MSGKRFQGQAVVITGAGSGIGRTTAIAFAQEGAAVAVIDQTDAAISETLRQVRAAGGEGIALQGDVTNAEFVAEAITRTISAFGKIDHAFNNAGVTQTRALTAEIPLDEWNRVIQVNLTGIWLCMREEIRYMAERGIGNIVNAASVAGLRHMAGFASYCVSKHAVVALTKTAAIEYGEKGLRINAVAPGGVLTPLMERGLAALDTSQRTAALTHTSSLHALKRLGTQSEIADAVLFLCSDAATFITGTCLSVDGGWAVA
jgi:NAD(P)-dependent dehydrogenase (short-subunit alcohol dehydrogenase family)